MSGATLTTAHAVRDLAAVAGSADAGAPPNALGWPLSRTLAILCVCLGGCVSVGCGGPKGSDTAKAVQVVDAAAIAEGIGVTVPHGAKLLYVHTSTESWQQEVRLRPLASPREEVVLWEGPDRRGGTYMVCSPSCREAAVCWREGASLRVLLLSTEDGVVSQIAPDLQVLFPVWRGDDTVALLTEDMSEWSFDVSTRHTSRSRSQVDALSFLESAYSDPIRTLRGLVRARKMPSWMDEREAALAILRGAGLPRLPPLASDIPIVRSVAAVSPDNHWVAYDGGGDGLSLVSASDGALYDRIQLPRVPKGEFVWTEDLHWSADSRWLTFTEVHNRPARFYASDRAGPPASPGEWRNLVRLYARESRHVITVAEGQSGVLIAQ